MMDAEAYSVPKRSQSCLTCRHKHLLGVPCPVFVFADTRAGRLERKLAQKRVAERQREQQSSSSGSASSLLSSSSSSEEEESTEDDSDADNVDLQTQMMGMLTRGVQKAREVASDAAAKVDEASRNAARKAQMASEAAGRLVSHKMKEMQGGDVVKQFVTPAWAKKCELRRCNCLAGVDNGDSRTYEPLTLPRFISNEIFPDVSIEVRMEEPIAGWQSPRRVLSPPGEVLDFVLRFLDAKTCSVACAVSRTFADRIKLQPHYLDMQSFRSEYDHRVHRGRVESCLVFSGKLYTAGDRGVKVWSLETFECLAEAVKDTAVVNNIKVVNNSLMVCASNGSIREWSLAHNPKRTEYRAAFWEHRSWINELILSTPEENEDGDLYSRVMFTASDDRDVKLWNTDTRSCIFTISPPNRSNGTTRSLARSNRHLYVGSSNGIIYVYPLERECERGDRHSCTVSEFGAVPFCLQTTLRHGEDIILAMECGGYARRLRHLVSASADGTVCIWSLPGRSGFEHSVTHVLDAHMKGGSITSIATSWAHLFTTGHDKRLRVWSLLTLELQKVLVIDSFVKCMHAAENDQCSYLYTGHVNGRITMWRLGLYV